MFTTTKCPQRQWQATRITAPSMKTPMEPGYSLRAEIRRLRAEQHDMLQSVDDLIEALGLDGEILARSASLGASLHKQLDILNGQHCHHLGKAISVASDSLHVDCTQKRWTVKKNADKARHNGFHANPVTVLIPEHETLAVLPTPQVLKECVEMVWLAPQEREQQHLDSHHNKKSNNPQCPKFSKSRWRV